jgi:ankyrin repeat protein
MIAYEKDYTKIVNLLLSRSGIDVNRTNGNGNTALIYASNKEDLNNYYFVVILILI